MDAFGFFASIIGSLAWPLAIIVLAVLFQAQLRDLIGRVSRAKAGPVEVWAEVRDKIVSEITAPAGTATGVATAHDPVVVTADADGVRLGGTAGAIASALGDQPLTISALISSMQHASTPEELAGRVVDYVSLRTVPGLRALSPDRIGLEKDLFGAILELQTLRATRAAVAYPQGLAAAIDQIDEFWSNPEQLSDEAVANTTVAVRAVIDAMKD